MVVLENKHGWHGNFTCRAFLFHFNAYIVIRCGLSQRAQSRHVKNEIRARIRAMIPGPGKVSENGLMLQAASRIKELEIEIDSASNYLERLQKLQSSGESADNNLKDQSVAAVVPAIQQAKDGAEALREVLPQPTKAKGKRLLESAWQYLTELDQEKNQLVDQIVEHQGRTEAQDPT